MTAWEELQQWLMKNVGGKEAEQCNDIVRRIVDETLASIRIEVSGCGDGPAGGDLEGEEGGTGGGRGETIDWSTVKIDRTPLPYWKK